MNRGKPIITIDASRLEQVVELLESISLENLVKRIEAQDPQYRSVRRLYHCRGLNNTALLVVLNALVSYRLTMKGEEWWNCWADYHSQRDSNTIEELVNDEVDFLEDCRGSIVQRIAKINRIMKLYKEGSRIIHKIYGDPYSILPSGRWLVKDLSLIYNTRPTSKTIVFSVKMLYYVLKADGYPGMAPIDIDIPVDVRVACFLYSTGIVATESYRQLVNQPTIAQKAVRLLAERLGVPPLNLDSLLWRTGWIPRDEPISRWSVSLREIAGMDLDKLFVKRCI